jgi:signal transduction histidine kinase
MNNPDRTNKNLNFKYNRRNIGILFTLAIIILAVSIVFFTMSLGRAPISVDLKLENRGWKVSMVDVNGLAYKEGIRVGDTPVEINGESAETFLNKYEKVGIVFQNLITRITTKDSNGDVKSADITRGSPTPESVIEEIAFIIISMVFCITGFFVFLKKPGNQATILLFLCGLVLPLTLSTNTAASRAIPLALIPAISSMLIGPCLLVHFFLILPEERTKLRNNPLTLLIYLPAIITIIFFPIIGYDNGQPVPWFHSFRLVEIGITFLVAAIIAVYNYVKAVSPRTRQQMRIVLISCIAAIIPILVLNILPQAIWSQPVISPGYSFLSFAFIPIGMGYAVITQRLMDIDVVIRRGIIYGLITIIMATIVSIAIFLMIGSQKTIGIPQDIGIALVLGAITAVLFGPVRKSVEVLVDKLFYKDRFDYRKTIQTLTNSLNSQQDLTSMARLVVGATGQTLNLAGACLFMKGQSGNLELNVAQGTFLDTNKQFELRALLNIPNRNTNIEFPNSASKLNPDITFLVPLVAGNQEVGILCLSPKISRQDFSSDDLFLIQGLSSVAATALRGALLSRDVSMRDTFVSIASHELLTPLTAVMGYSELLLKRESDETKQKWTRIISENAQNMSRIINDLLNVSRIQSGRIGLKLEPVKITAVLEDRLEMARENSQKHKFILDIEMNIPDIYVDRDKFSQIIWNLLSNAIKYSPNGGTIKLTAKKDRDKDKVIISVSDHGIGISQADSESLFKTFHRIQRPETVTVRGSGLGLFIVKEWIEAMGGQVWLDSTLNVGSTFYITAPIFRPAP